MITLLQTEPVGRVKRGQRTNWDRKVAARYGQPRLDPQAKGQQLAEQWTRTPMEEWALDNDLCIGMSLQDDRLALKLPPHQRPALVRLGALSIWQLPGGVLIESLENLGDTLACAAVCRWLRQYSDVIVPARELSYRQQRQRVRRLSAAKIREWEQEIGPAAVEEAFIAYGDAVRRVFADLFCQLQLDFYNYVGSGPLRDTDLAREQDARLQAEGWSDRMIRDYLELHGYLNPKRNVGRWSPAHLRALRSSS